MKISVFSIPDIPQGKRNIKDIRLDQVDKMNNAKKKTYAQVELLPSESVLEAEAILVLRESTADLILKDLEFVETRLSRSEAEQEKGVLNKLKNILEKEEFVFKAAFNEEEKKIIDDYGLITNRPVIIVDRDDLIDEDNLLMKAVTESGFISFFTANERETRAWLAKKGITAHEAAGLIHSDIQRGFIRAEVIGFSDLVESGSITQAKQANRVRLQQKDYLMQDADLVNFRFNK